MDKLLERKDLFAWEIIYRDGTSIREFDEKGRKVNNYPGSKINGEIKDFENEKDFERYKEIEYFHLFKIDDVLAAANGERMLVPFTSVHIPLLGRLFWRRRSRLGRRRIQSGKETRLVGGASTVKERIFLLGWRKENREIVDESILYISVSFDMQNQLRVAMSLDGTGNDNDFLKFEQFPSERIEKDNGKMGSIGKING